MMYEAYEKRVRRFLPLANTVKICVKCAVLLLILAAVLLLGYLSLRGIYFGDLSLQDTKVTFGDLPEYDCFVLLGNYKCEYAAVGSENWTATQPTIPGIYRVRAVITKGLFGKRIYSEAGTVQLSRRQVTLRPEDKSGANAEYGESPVFGKHWQLSKDRLAKGHKIETAALTYYTYDGRGGAICHVDASSVVIRDRSGRDVTAGYDLSVMQGTIEVAPRKITVVVSEELKNGKPVNITKVYDGKSTGTDRYYLTKGTLLGGDAITIVPRGNPADVGKHENSVSISIENGAGQDRSAYYRVTLKLCKVVIEPRPITVTTPDVTLVYTGQTQYTNQYEITSGSLVTGQYMEFVHNEKTGILNVTKRAQDNKVLFRVLESGRDVTKNYDITYEYGSLTVTPRVLHVRTEDSQGLIYNGEEQSWPAFDILSGSLGAGHSLSVKKAASQKVPGSCENRVDYEILDSSGKKVTENYQLSVEYGTLTVGTGALVTFGLLDLSKTYDASALSPADYSAEKLVSVVAGTLFSDDYVEIVRTYGSQTDAGSSTYTVEYRIMHKEGFAGKAVDATDWYRSGLANDGVLTVTKRTVTIKFDPITKKYDGKAAVPAAPNLKDSALSRFEGKGHKIVLSEGAMQALTYTLAGHPVSEAVAIGKYTYTLPTEYLSVVLDDGSGADRTHNYEFVFSGNTIQIGGVTLKLAAPSGEKPYDGTPLTAESFSLSQVKETWGAQGYHATYTLSGSQTNAGVGSLQIQNVQVWDQYGNNVTENFEITTTPGKLTVTPISISVKSSSGSKTYDGQPMENATQMTLVSGKLIAGHVLGGAVKSDYVTDVGEHANDRVTPKVYTATGQDVTANYRITLNPGRYFIEPAYLTIEAPLVQGEYAGAPYKGTCDATASAVGLAKGHKVELNVTSQGVELGVHSMTVGGWKIMDSRGRDVTYNYIVTVTDGQLEIVPRRISVITGSSTVAYEDAPAINEELRVQGSGLIDGHLIRAIFTHTNGLHEIGAVSNTLEDVRVVNAAGADVTHYYDISFQYGMLRVKQIEITVTTGSETKATYDGQPIVAAYSKVTAGKLLSGHRLEVQYKYADGVSDVGKWKNTLSYYRITDAEGNDVTHMYNVHVDAGILEITDPYEVYMQSFDAEKVYDGETLSNTEYILHGELLPGHTISGVKPVTVELVGEQQNALSLIILDENGKDVSKNYRFSYMEGMLGTLRITHRPMHVTLGHVDVTYNGTTKLVAPQSQLQIEGLVSGQRLSLPVLVESPEIGDKTDAETGGARVYDVRGRDVTHCYYMTIEADALHVTVQPAELTLYLPTQFTKEYDGTGVDAAQAGYRPTGLATGHSVEYVATSTPAEPGDYTITFSHWAVYDNQGNDVTANYTVTAKSCAVNIHRIYVKLISESASRHYNGTPLTMHALKSSTLPEGYTVEVSYTGSQTAIGKSENTFDAVVYDAEGNDVTAYCNVSKSYGVLEVWGQLDLELTSLDAMAIYSGEVLTRHELAPFALPEGYSLEAFFTGERTMPGESANTFTVVIYDPTGEIATDAFAITYHFGTLTVLQKSTDWVITLTSISASKSYDGTPLTAHRLQPYELPDGFYLDVTWTGSQTKLGVSQNTFTARAYNDLVQELTIEYQYGALEVTLDVTVHAYEMTFTYDGTEKNCEDVWVEGLPEGYRVDVEFGAGLTVTGSKNVEFASVRVYDAQGNDITDLCNLTLKTAKLTVKPRTLTVYVYGQSADSIVPVQGSLVQGHTMFAEYGENGECYIEITDQSGALVYSNRGDSPVRYTLYDVIIQYG